MFRWLPEWLNCFGWPSAITAAGTASSGVAESFVKTSSLARTRHTHQVTTAALHILQQIAFLSCVEFEPDHVSSRNSGKHRWRLNNRSLNTGLLFLISSCVRLVHSVRCGEYHPCVKCPTRPRPWRLALDRVNYVMSNFELAQLLPLVIFVCVWKTKQSTQAQDLAMNGFAVLASKCAEEGTNASRQLAVHSPVRMW